MDNQKYRPLIKLQHCIEHIFLPTHYNYSLSEIARIKKYLPKIYSFFGVDAHSYSESEQPLFQREKLKLKAVDGRSIVDQKPIRFYKDTQLQTKQWRDIFICVDIPFNSRQNQQSAKQQLQSKLDVFLQTAMVFRNNTTHQIYRHVDRQNIKLSELSIYFEPIEIKGQAFDNSYRQVRCHLPIFVAVAKAESHSVASLFQYIRDDVVNSLKIMIKNQLAIRIINHNQHLFLQSFIKSQAERDVEQKKLVGILEKREVAEGGQGKDESGGQVQSGQGGQEGSNRGLIAILIALAVIYIYLKLNPLQKTLQNVDNPL